mgnify:CR=1 FL=1
MIKRSRQREAIRQCLTGRYDHPTAETVYMSIKDEFPNILARCRSPGFQLSARRNLVPVDDQFDAAGLGNFIGFTGQAVADVVQAVAMMLYQ